MKPESDASAFPFHHQHWFEFWIPLPCSRPGNFRYLCSDVLQPTKSKAQHSNATRLPTLPYLLLTLTPAQVPGSSALLPPKWISVSLLLCSTTGAPAKSEAQHLKATRLPSFLLSTRYDTTLVHSYPTFTTALILSYTPGDQGE